LVILVKEPQAKIKMLTLRRKQSTRKEVPYDKQIFDYVTSEEAAKQEVKKSKSLGSSNNRRNKNENQKLNIKDDTMFLAPEAIIFDGAKSSHSKLSAIQENSSVNLTSEQVQTKENIKNDLKDLDNIMNNMKAVVNDKKK